MGKRGPAPKAEGEKYIGRSFKIPPALWADVLERIPEGERSTIVQNALERAVQRSPKAAGVSVHRRRFVAPAERSPEFDAAVEALEKLLPAKDGLDQANRAYADAVWAATEESFGRIYGLKRSSGAACWHRLLGQRCPTERACERIPGSDHTTLWLRDGKPAVIVSQPYYFETDTLQKLLAFIEPRELDVLITGTESWHFPGNTLLVQIYRKGEHPWNFAKRTEEPDAAE